MADLIIEAPTLRVAGAAVERLPVGLDWKAYSERCFPGGKRHDFDAVVAYFDYKGSGTRPPGSREFSEAEQAWEDEGGSVEASKDSMRRNVDGSGRPPRLLSVEAASERLFP